VFLVEQNDQSKHTYNARDKVRLSLIVKINFYKKIFHSNSNQLTTDQLQAILRNENIRKHLIQVGYVSFLF
jgi:hypothetical protein